MIAIFGPRASVGLNVGHMPCDLGRPASCDTKPVTDRDGRKRGIQSQNERLESTVRELDESNKGITSLHAELLASADVLRRTAEVKSRVVANVSHEFRTPVHMIRTLMQKPEAVDLVFETPPFDRVLRWP